MLEIGIGILLGVLAFCMSNSIKKEKKARSTEEKKKDKIVCADSAEPKNKVPISVRCSYFNEGETLDDEECPKL